MIQFLCISDGNEVIPVVTGSRDDVAILPLSQGTQFTLFTTPVDNVGNRKPLEVSMQDSIEIEFPIVIATCPNNCSGNGNCTVFGDCVCDDGFYGNNCSEGMYAFHHIIWSSLMRLNTNSII